MSTEAQYLLVVINGLAGIVLILIMFILRAGWSKLNEIEKDVSDFREEVAGQYIKREEVHQDLIEIKTGLRELSTQMTEVMVEVAKNGSSS